MSFEPTAVVVDSLVVEPCPDCCECLAPQWRTVVNTAMFSKLGCLECTSPLPAVPKYYRQATYSGALVGSNSNADPAEEYDVDIRPVVPGGDTFYIPRPGESGELTAELYVQFPNTGSVFTVDCPAQVPEGVAEILSGFACNVPIVSVCTSSTSITYAASDDPDCDFSISSNSLTGTLSVEHTTVQLLEDVVAVLPGYGAFSYGILSSPPRSTLSLTADEVTALARAERYALAFPVPPVLTCFRASWIERFVPSAGSPIDSVEVAYRGLQYTAPTITITDPTGSGAVLSAVLERGRIVSITVDDPGDGYTNPTITITDSTGTGAAAGCVHFGTETARSAQWDGVTPEGYDPDLPDTWPRLTPDGDPDSYWTLEVPEETGTLSIACFTWSCRDCDPAP